MTSTCTSGQYRSCSFARPKKWKHITLDLDEAMLTILHVLKSGVSWLCPPYTRLQCQWSKIQVPQSSDILELRHFDRSCLSDSKRGSGNGLSTNEYPGGWEKRNETRSLSTSEGYPNKTTARQKKKSAARILTLSLAEGVNNKSPLNSLSLLRPHVTQRRDIAVHFSAHHAKGKTITNMRGAS